ncbi:MAG: M23 family metallopeptidase [Oscillospiraceae bacterium]|nr:M23 family metallopeptidase [Oscillospiraceae bacterium]
MKYINGLHKQSKKFTVMLIPDSSARVRSLHIPYWVFGLLVVPVLTIVVVAVLFQARVFSLENLLDYSASQLMETADEKDRLRETLLAEDASVEAYGGFYEGYVDIEEYLRAAQNELTEEQLHEIMDRLNAIDDMKHGIVSVLLDIAALEAIPFLFDEITLSGGVDRARGGPYTEGPEDIIAELDSILAGSLDDMNVLIELAEDLEDYFRARPIGWPVATERRIGSEFGYRPNPFTGSGMEMHTGIDINVPIGTEVFSTAYGVVEFAGWHNMGYGYLVVIVHDFGYSTFFAHNSEVLVTLGQEVERGELIALSGNTGRSTGPHVHYEVRHNGIPVNPRQYLD